MTREQILKRIEALEEQRRNRIADIHAIEGAVQDCQYWLEQIEKNAEKEQNP